MKNKNDLESEKVNGTSSLYMGVWFLITTLIIVAMTVQFLGIQSVIIQSELSDSPISVNLINQYSSNIPYEPLIYTLVVYMLGLFGIEGTRSVIKSFDVSGLQKEAASMPPYKRRRLISMVFTFFALAILAMIYQLLGSKATADYHLETIFYGILFGGSLIAYSDMAPKLSNDISQNVVKKNQNTTTTSE